MDELVIPSPADFHTHLRQNELMKLVTPHVKQGGMHLAYVMPNLSPPITTVDMAVKYRQELQALEPDVHFLMTLFLSPSLTPQEIIKAKENGISGVKSYPRGVTTGSESGVESYERYYQVFEEMERQNLVLNLHGEVPSSASNGTSVLNAEARFLGHLKSLHARFPRLRIVLEHATTSEAVEAVQALGPTVACSITVHHLFLTIDDVVGQPLHFCKPVAKTYEDRQKLRQVIAEGNKKFFLGSDSAPHPFSNKMPGLKVKQETQEVEEGQSHACAAGVYTSPFLLPLVAHAFEAEGMEPKIPLERLAGFVGGYGRKFYGVLAEQGQQVKLRRTDRLVPAAYSLNGQDWVIPFKAGKSIGWEIVQDI